VPVKLIDFDAKNAFYVQSLCLAENLPKRVYTTVYVCYHAVGRSPGRVVHKHTRENRSDATNRPAAAPGPKCLHNRLYTCMLSL